MIEIHEMKIQTAENFILAYIIIFSVCELARLSSLLVDSSDPTLKSWRVKLYIGFNCVKQTYQRNARDTFLTLFQFFS